MARRHGCVKNHTFAGFIDKHHRTKAIRAAFRIDFVVIKNSNGPQAVAKFVCSNTLNQGESSTDTVNFNHQATVPAPWQGGDAGTLSCNSAHSPGA